jgi:hypothetical protein
MIKKGDLVQYIGGSPLCTRMKWYGMVKGATVDGVCEIIWFGKSAQKLIGVMDFIPQQRLRKVNDLPRL